MAYSNFSQEDVEEFREVFQFFDDMNSGNITAKQLGTTLRSLEPRPPETDVTNLMDKIAKNKNGVVNFREFLEYLHATISVNSNECAQHSSKKLAKRKTSCYTNLTTEQMEDIKDTFNMFDQNGDGSISKEELKVVMKSLGQDASDESIREMLHDVGCSNNDSLDYPEFVSMMTRKVAAQDLNKEMREVFRFFDQDNDGSITAEEVKTVMAKLGEDLTEDEIDEMVKEADADGNGQIEYAEFVKMITWPKC